MNDPNTIYVSCSSHLEIVGACNDAVRKLDPSSRDQLNQAFSNYLARFGIEGVFERFNGRSVSQILSEREFNDSTVVDEGEQDDVKWTLYEGNELQE